PFHGSIEISQLETLTAPRYALEAAQHVTAKGFSARGRQRYSIAHRLAQPFDGDRARSKPFPGTQRPQLRTLLIELIAAFTKEFLQQIFQCNQADNPLVFVNDDRELKASTPHFVEQLAQRLTGRHKVRRPDKTLQARWRRFQAARHEILDVQDADNI